MNNKKIISVKQTINLSKKYKASGEEVILVGGCFDILHIGHIRFLEEAKKLGGKLFVLLESDRKVKQLKGKKRPVFSQKERAHTLASLSSVDYIILLAYLQSSDYDEMITNIQPNIIACTENDPLLEKKKYQIEKVSGKLVTLPYFKSLSSTKIASLLSKENL